MEEIIIPEGWTYFVHRTNTDKWQTDPFNGESIKLNKLMCVVSEKEVHREIEHFGKIGGTTYSNGNGQPFEIRTLICELPYSKTIEDKELSDLIHKKFYFDRMNFGGAYGMRHPSIPKGEELIILGYGEYDPEYECEKKIIWTIPKSLYTFYQKEIEKGNNRYVGLSVPTDSKSM